MAKIDPITKALAITDLSLREFFPADYHKRCLYASFGLAALLRDEGIYAQVMGGDFLCAVVSQDGKQMSLQGFGTTEGEESAHYWVEAAEQLLDLGPMYLPEGSSFPASAVPILRWPLAMERPDFVAYRERARYSFNVEISNVEFRERNADFVAHARAMAKRLGGKVRLTTWQLRGSESLRYAAGKGDHWACAAIEFLRRSLKAEFPETGIPGDARTARDTETRRSQTLEVCYVCEKPFNDTDVKRHEEHIIPNSIGGKLTSSDFLCEKCGGCLGRTIDGPLGDRLGMFCVLHGVSRDRGETTKAVIDVTSRATPRGGSRPVTYYLNSDFTITPDRPIHFVDDDRQLVTVCCSLQKQVKAYVQNRDIQTLLEAGYKLEVKPDMAEYLVNSALKVDPDSHAILRGVAKIAIEYALHCGIPFAGLKDFKDRFIESCDAAQLRRVVSQYYPVTDEEKLYETGKFRHEDWYPNHQLFLFSHRCNLYCYVELFGAVQKYVHLSSTFGEDIVVEKYLQKVTSWEFNEADWSGGPKDLHLFAGQFEIPFEGRPLKDVQRDVLNAARTRSYDLDAEAQLEKVQDLVQHLVSYVFSDFRGIDVVDELLQKAADAKLGLGFSLVDRLKLDKLHAQEWIWKDFSGFRITAGGELCANIGATLDSRLVRQYAAFRLYETLCSVGKEHEIDFLLQQEILET